MNSAADCLGFIATMALLWFAPIAEQGSARHYRRRYAGSYLCRRHGISDATFYKWRSKYGGMEVSDARELKALEDENRKLKKLLAESMLDAATLKEMLGKNF